MFGRPLVVTCLLLLTAPLSAAEGPFFEERVHGLLKTYCWKCHGGEARKAGLDLRSQPLAIKGGKSGPAVVPGSVDKSLLIKKLVAGEMPPGKELKPTRAHIELITAWVAAGAQSRYTRRALSEAEEPAVSESARSFWSFRTPQRPAVPAVRDGGRVRTPVDAFVIARLEEAGLGLASPAEKTSLVRRAYLDLLGLPPPPAAVEAFLADRDPGAWNRLIDSLLGNPLYGERWGRHWLDTAGYVDTIGTDNDAGIIKPAIGIWRYRDWVVRAFNDDKPFDEFLVEQLAGDELVDWRDAREYSPDVLQKLIATGYLRLTRDVTYAPELNTADIRHQVLYDTLQTISSGLIGLTVHCAQCHSHKFDPISQADYYRLATIFTPSFDVQNWMNSDERHLYTVSKHRKGEIDSHNTRVNSLVGAEKKKSEGIRGTASARVRAAKLAALPEQIRSDTDAAVKTLKGKRSPLQAYLAGKLGPLLKVVGGEIDKELTPAEKQQIATHQAEISRLNGSRQSYERIQALWEQGPVPATYLYRRGDFTTPGPQVGPGVPVVLDPPGRPTRFTTPAKPARSTGRRLAFARWLTKKDNPLTARVIVNRLWQRYFGTGLVATPDNFGASGSPPTHPRLLDWLARELVDSGWSLKQVHRGVLLSATYRQSTSREPAEWDRAVTADPGNLLLWRMPLRRLESEVIRDSVLAVSGELDRYQGGPAVPIKANADSSVVVETAKLVRPTDDRRRSMYLLCRRNYQLTELIVFDQPTVAHNCTRRDRSAVVLQSLAMLNGPFVMAQSRKFAARVRAEGGTETASRVTWAFRLALGRRPTAEELRLSGDLLAAQAAGSSADAALDHLCHMLLNTNEFLYVP